MLYEVITYAETQDQVVIQMHGFKAQAQPFNRATYAEVEEVDWLNVVDTLRPIGQIDWAIQIVHEDTDDFTKTKRHDGQIVTAQFERWCA